MVVASYRAKLTFFFFFTCSFKARGVVGLFVFLCPIVSLAGRFMSIRFGLSNQSFLMCCQSFLCPIVSLAGRFMSIRFGLSNQSFLMCCQSFLCPIFSLALRFMSIRFGLSNQSFLMCCQSFYVFYFQSVSDAGVPLAFQ
jgi:hypothetical protein